MKKQYLKEQKVRTFPFSLWRMAWKSYFFFFLFLVASVQAISAKDSGECFVILIEQTNAPEQSYQFYDDFTLQNVKDIWAKKRDMSSVKYTKAGWLAVSQKECKGSKQRSFYNYFKGLKKTCEENAKNGIFVTSLSLCNLVGSRWYWWAFANIKPGTKTQVIEMVSSKNLNKWAEKQAAKGLKITQCVRKFGDCAVVAQDGTDIDKQMICFYDKADAALDDIKQKWNAGWRVGNIDVSAANKYLVVYNTYTKPHKGQQYIAYCDSRQSAANFIKKRTNKYYHISQIGGSFYEGAKDDNGNEMSFMEILGGLVTKSAQLYSDIKGNNNSYDNTSGGYSEESGASTSSLRTQQDYQKEYDRWAEKAKHVAMQWYKHGKIDNQNHKQGQITAGDRKQLRNYQKIMKNVVNAAAQRGFNIRRADIENFNP